MRNSFLKQHIDLMSAKAFFVTSLKKCFQVHTFQKHLVAFSQAYFFTNEIPHKIIYGPDFIWLKPPIFFVGKVMNNYCWLHGTYTYKYVNKVSKINKKNKDENILKLQSFVALPTDRRTKYLQNSCSFMTDICFYRVALLLKINIIIL